MTLKGEVKRGLPERRVGREKMTTYLASKHAESLREVSERSQIPIGRLIDQALDEYFQMLNWQEGPVVPPIDKKYIAKRIASKGE